MKPFKLIVAGGRDFFNEQWIEQTVFSLIATGFIPHDDPTLVCGMAIGADLSAFNVWSKYRSPIIRMPADWQGLGRSAGYIRNVWMAEEADALLAFWDGQSKGTAHMIKTMERMGKPVRVIRYDQTTRGGQQTEQR